MLRRRKRQLRHGAGMGALGGWLVIDDAHRLPIVEAPPPVTEHVRYMVERLRLRDEDGLPATIGVTSALPDEGASLIARTLAGVLAGDADRRVCLISLDWWNASTQDSNRGGIAHVVYNQAELGFVLLQTSMQGLDYLPAGGVEPEILPELVRSTALRHILRELGMRYNHIVMELPPVRLTSESLALAGNCDACVVVVRQGATSRNDVQHTIESLGEDRLLGVVMNQAGSKVPDFLLRAVAPS